MRYLALIVIAASFYQLLSYAKYSWKEGNRSAAAGALIMALITLTFPVVTMFIIY